MGRTAGAGLQCIEGAQPMHTKRADPAHEDCEELEKALACYRNAVRIDPRHYNAWYGIGLTYYKQERFSLADGMLIKKFGNSLFATFSNNL